MRFSPPPEESRYLDRLEQAAAAYFCDKFPNCISQHGTQWATFPDGRKVYFLQKSYWDEHLGIQYRVIVIDNLGQDEYALSAIAQYKFDDGRQIGSITKDGVPSAVMPMAARLFIYTDKLHCDIKRVNEIFSTYNPNAFVEVVDESQIHNSIFISYGGPDETIASRINDWLNSRGVSTWFFPRDALPGDKLHRVMSEGIQSYDRVLLICSEFSLDRSGVLNELERVLEREASEGGSDILIPITIDDFIFSTWQPARDDIARQIRSRVIVKIPAVEQNESDFQNTMEKLLSSLRSK